MYAYPNRVTVDLGALIYNLNQIRGLLRAQTRVVGMVKSDAYGHGLLPVSRTLEKNDIYALGVAYVREALELRGAGIRVPIVVVCGLSTGEECSAVVAHGLTPVVYDLPMAERLDREGERRHQRVPVYVKIDTGMGRLGIRSAHVARFLDRLMHFKHLDVAGMTSHLSTADEPESRFVEHQRAHFEEAVSVGRSKGFALACNSMANSAGVVVDEGLHFDLIRCGIMLYGGLPAPDFVSPVPLRPVMRFKARILQVRTLDPQSPVSYGRTYYTRGPCTVAVISAGYGNGLPRQVSNRGYVLIGGKKAPIIGNICMNLTICDVTDMPAVRAGDEAVILGSQGGEEIRGEDIAKWAHTISYEVFCTIGQMNRREYEE
ncbi:MAG: alanine racemase [Deltaproteobacteria bacterium]|nr:alanine racemase [Deltaproteobacteria bacterium]MCF8118971.1 alanine racemase [Deltaproteobacteria bacterium]